MHDECGLPEELGGRQVVGIGYNALNTYEMYYEHSFTLVIPEGVEEIGSFAFYDWEFGTVTLPESLRVIETEAFAVLITNPVVIPAGTELVQRGAFFGDEDGVVVVAASQSTHFETAEEYEARVGYAWWGDEE